ncbi:ATP-dependent DNA helicase PIF1-like [Solanum pennellii]|uniref:ATP-dependent DNA helicase PIF1-like n=1 Tax=Solanum pennellii TaxID=28526 RepID=A0ABM1FQM2_SOLPN|nr:ATP-dependent DNA helicase PIF1-like [Solanum pennellii]
MRARTDPTFSEFLLRVGNCDEPTIRENLVLLPEQLTIKHSQDGIQEESIIKEIFQNLQENAATTKSVTKRAILASRNDHVNKINDKLISQFPGGSKIFNSFDSEEDDTNYYQEEYLNTLTTNGLPLHRLELKENVPIMLLRNLDPSSGLCNGTRMICRGFSQNVLHTEISSGHSATKYVFLPRIQLSQPQNEGYPFKFIGKQLSVRLCFAMTINKAQGQTIHNVGLYLP